MSSHRMCDRVYEDKEGPGLRPYAGEIEVVLSFCWIMIINNVDVMTHVTVSMSRYLILILSFLSFKKLTS